MEKQPLDFHVLEQPVTTLDASGVQQGAPRWKALVREDNNRVLAIVNSTYRVVQFPELLQHTEQQIRDVFPSAGFSLTQRVAFGGRTGYAEYVFPEILVDVPDRDAQVRFRIIVSNSFGQERVKLYSGAIDGYCSNGMIFGDYGSAFWKHTKNLNIHAEFTGQIRKCFELYTQNSEKLRDWMLTRVAREDVDAFFDALPVGEKLREKLASHYLERERHQRGETLWSVYSALTYYASHASDVFPTRNTGRDHLDYTLMKRQQAVAKWTALPEWEAMAA